MNNLSRALAITFLVAAVPATIALAQQADEGAPPTETAEKNRGPSPETMARLQDGRIAMAKTALKLTPEQEKLWTPVEEKIRARFEERKTMRDEWRAKRDERRAERKERRGKGAKTPLPERIEKRADRMTERAGKMTERATKMKEFAAVVKPFYDSLTDEQKDVAQVVLPRLAKGGFGHGRGHHGRRGGKMCHKGMGHRGGGHRGGGWH